MKNALTSLSVPEKNAFRRYPPFLDKKMIFKFFPFYDKITISINAHYVGAGAFQH